MVFNSFQFVLFFIVVLVVYFGLPHRHRWIFLLPASYYFYMCWKPEFIVLLLATTLVDYGLARLIASSTSRGLKRAWLTLSCCISVGVLFAFKYLDFFSESVNAFFRSINVLAELPTFQLLLPVGISFYTFQSLSYVIDVYRGTTPVEKHLGIFALYVVFFPQLVAGPIERSTNLLPQFYRRHRVEYARVRTGLQLVLWGLFKKMVVADLLAPAVETVYAHPQTFTGPPLVLATFFFAVQIYCDFSGYSDIAIGVARIMGFDLMTNFRQPYFAGSIAGFWHRWHISLSTWFRDYVYYPMGGSRVPTRLHWARNIMTVFVISGIWHGANWTFLVWGVLHGTYMLVEEFTRPLRARVVTATSLDRVPRVYHVMKVAVVFFLVLVGWVFFRAENFADAGYILTHAHHVRGFGIHSLFALGLPRFEVVLAFAVIATLFAVEYCQINRPGLVRWLWARRGFRWGAYAAGFYAIVFFGVFERVQFIYFQF